MRICSVPGCTGRHLGRGLCRSHYQKAQRAGTLDDLPRVGRLPVLQRACEVPGCSAKRFARGFCQPHYAIARREGQIEVVSQVPPARANVFEATGGRCMNVPDPCQVRQCRYHLAELRRESRERNQDLTEPCCLKLVDDEGAMTLERIGDVFGITRERVRQIENHGLRKFRDKMRALGYTDDEIMASIAAMHPARGEDEAA